ncbi:SdrD B-like domain [Spirosoma fluviale]|uniref:SdrD B-like domain n=2 Tax=Spirosoma fluviale TaxID=1597977 RepID=A0A286G534_9BACT|nr:SdrD B-like domain [Spirosoma fluviale]
MLGYVNEPGSDVSSKLSDKPVRQTFRTTSWLHRPPVQRFMYQLMLFLAITFSSLCAYGQSITGKVFFDGNNNGAFESSNEVGFGGVTVKAYDATNTAVASTVTTLSSSLGSYTLSGLTTGTTYRVEFTLPSGYNDGAQGSGSLSSVQFIKAGSTANLGVYTTGLCDRDKTVRVVAGCAVVDGGEYSVASWNYFDDRKTTIEDETIDPHNDDIKNADVGIPMGMGARSRDKLMFFSTVSAPLAAIFPPAPDGASAIYVANYSGSGNSYVGSKLLTKLSSLSPSINVGNQSPVGSNDNVGEYGLGGVDLTDDGKTLYVVNMGNGKIVKLDVSGVTFGSIPGGGYTNLTVSEITIPTDIATCTNGRFRPSALEVYAGSLYVGGVCDASGSSTASNLRLKILKMDLTTSTWTSLLDYDLSQIEGGTLFYNKWPNVKWKDNFVGDRRGPGEIQPFVNDIAIDDYGSVIIGVSNRKVFSTDSDVEMGYMLRTFRKADGTMAMENNGVAGPLTSNAKDSPSKMPGLNAGSDANMEMISSGPGGDWFLEIARTTSHPFLHTGGIFILPGTKELVSGFADPLDGIVTAGARYIGYDDGVTTYGISLTKVKQFALTGVDAVCETASIEIGNLVWKDTNLNGRQDPDEPALEGVTVTLKDGSGTTLATATTDNNGNYIFSSGSGTSSGSRIYSIAGLSPLSSYKVTIDNAAAQTPLAGLGLTTANIASDGEDNRDSDATLVATNAEITITTKEAGANNHTYDFGFNFACPNGNCFPSIVRKN